MALCGDHHLPLYHLLWSTIIHYSGPSLAVGVSRYQTDGLCGVTRVVTETYYCRSKMKKKNVTVCGQKPRYLTFVFST